MFATPFTALAATPVKSGPVVQPPDCGVAVVVAGAGRLVVCAAGGSGVDAAAAGPWLLSAASPAARARSAIARPAPNPRTRRRTGTRSPNLRDIDATSAAAASLRDREREEAVFQVGRHLLDVNRLRQDERARERAVSTLDPVVLFARNLRRAAIAANHDAVFLGVNLDLIAAEARNFGGQDECAGGLVQIDGGRPSGSVGADQLTDLIVKREQIAQWIPARERHLRIVAWVGRARPYVLGSEGYTVMPSFIQATRLRKGNLIKVGNDLFRILELHHLTPGNKRAHIQVRMRNIRTLTLADEKFRAEEDVERATLDEREMQYLYNDGDHYYFMDTSTYEQIHISREALGDSSGYLIPESIIRVEFYGEEPVGIELAPTVDLVVKETVPGIKGATASAQVKPATLETGLVVTVPSFINEGDKIRINTETGEYQSRV